MGKHDTHREKLTILVACLISAGWAVSFTLDIVIKDFDPHPSITPLMLAVAGFLFGGEVMSKFERKNKDETEVGT